MSRRRIHGDAGLGAPVLRLRVPPALLARLHAVVAPPEHGRQGKLSQWLLEVLEGAVSAEEAKQVKPVTVLSTPFVTLTGGDFLRPSEVAAALFARRMQGEGRDPESIALDLDMRASTMPEYRTRAGHRRWTASQVQTLLARATASERRV